MTWGGPADFGVAVPGLRGMTATGTTQATAQALARKVSVFTTVALGAGCVLPSAYAPGTELKILNRGVHTLLVWPSGGDQIETLGINVAVAIAPGGVALFSSFDPPLAAKPRIWWLS